jgi:hypothetical protein
MDSRSFDRVLANADLFLNVSRSAVLREAYAACPCKIFIDGDPGRNHLWNFPRLDADPTWSGGIGYRHHDHFFTYAERIGRSDCALPRSASTGTPRVLRWCSIAGIPSRMANGGRR